MKRLALPVAALAVLAASFFAYEFVGSHSLSSIQTDSATSTATFTVSNAALELPQDQPPCQGLFCQSYALLSGTVFVHANSPVSCIDTYVTGTSEGSTC